MPGDAGKVNGSAGRLRAPKDGAVPASSASHSAVQRKSSRTIAGTSGDAGVRPAAVVAGARHRARPDRNGGPTRIRTWNQRIHFPGRFHPARTISSPSAARWWGAGRSSLSSRALQPPGSLCTFRRCTAGLAQDCHRPANAAAAAVSLNSSRFSAGPSDAGVTFR